MIWVSSRLKITKNNRYELSKCSSIILNIQIFYQILNIYFPRIGEFPVGESFC